MRNLLLGIAVIAPIAVALFLFLPLKFRLKLVVTQDKFDQTVYIKPPFSPWFIPLPMPGTKARQRAAALRTSPPGFKAFRVKSAVKAAKGLLTTIKRVSSEAIKAFSVERLWVLGKVGTGDAFNTAIAVGSLGSLSGVTLSLLRRKGVGFTETPRVRFVPDYSEPSFSVNVDAIISASVWAMAKVGFSLRRIIGPQIRAVKSAAKNQVSGETVEY